jgi:hypothetical protein
MMSDRSRTGSAQAVVPCTDLAATLAEALLAAWVALRAPAGVASRATGPARDDRRPLLLVGAALAIVILAALALALGTSPR